MTHRVESLPFDGCTRKGCGHAAAAHDRDGTRDACALCECHAYRPDLRRAVLIGLTAVAGIALVVYLGTTTGAHP